jgi:hypothetical protein
MQENPRQLVKIGLPVSVMDVQSLALKGVAHLAVDVFPNRIGVTGVFNCESEWETQRLKNVNDIRYLINAKLVNGRRWARTKAAGGLVIGIVRKFDKTKIVGWNCLTIWGKTSTRSLASLVEVRSNTFWNGAVERAPRCWGRQCCALALRFLATLPLTVCGMRNSVIAGARVEPEVMACWRDDVEIMPETTVAGGVTMAVAVGATGTVGVAAWDMNGLEMVR